MRSVPVAYAPGNPWGICQRCGFKFRLSDLRKEWSGLTVCDKDHDPLPDTMRPVRNAPEGLVRRDASPQPADVFVSTPTTPNDL